MIQRFMIMRLIGQIRLPIVLAGIALLAGLAFWAGLPAVEHAFSMLGLEGFVLVVLIHLLPIVLMGAAWWSIGQAGRRASLPSFIAARLVRDSVAELLPFSQVGGFAAGVRLLSLTGVPARAGAFSLFADLLMEFFSKLLYAMAGLALVAWLRPGSRLPPYLLLTLALLVGACVVLLFIRGPLLRIVLRFLRRLGMSDSKLRGLRYFLVPKRLAPSGLLHAFCWALGGIEAYVTLRLMGIPLTVVQALAIDSLVTSLRTFGFWVPAALGVQEAAYVLVCGLFGLSPDVAIAFSLVRRARDILLGLAGLAVWQGLEVRRARRPAVTETIAVGTWLAP
jgi:putative membrane protein